MIHNLLMKANMTSIYISCACKKFGVGLEEVCSLLVFRNLQVTKIVEIWHLDVRSVKQVYNQSHCILFNILRLVQIPEAKLDYIKGSERFVKSKVLSDVSKVWLEELIKFGQDLMHEHDISKLFLLFLRRIFISFEKEVAQGLTNFFRRI